MDNPKTNIRLLGGISGCDVMLDERGIVTKSTKIKSYRERLIQQGNKQSLFSKFVLKNITTPRVLEIGKNSIQMEYVEAQSFDNFLTNATRKDILFVTDSLCQYISFLKDRSRPSNAGTLKTIEEKINSLKEKSNHKNIIDLLLQKTKTMDVSEIPNSFCHGDLTFSNILFHKNRLYFIDFLDTFINSYLLDLTKLKQDLYYGWSGKINGTSSIRISQAKRHIWKGLCEQHEDIIKNEWFSVLDTLNILRIEPYLQSEHQRDVFEGILKETL